jgi:hypothetical protein
VRKNVSCWNTDGCTRTAWTRQRSPADSSRLFYSNLPRTLTLRVDPVAGPAWRGVDMTTSLSKRSPLRFFWLPELGSHSARVGSNSLCIIPIIPINTGFEMKKFSVREEDLHRSIDLFLAGRWLVRVPLTLLALLIRILSRSLLLLLFLFLLLLVGHLGIARQRFRERRLEPLKLWENVGSAGWLGGDPLLGYING